MVSRKPLVGVVGGMGPLATVDFLHKIVEECPADRDQDHVPVLAWNVPQIPDRQKALAATGESPLAALQAAVRLLEAAGATRIVIPCNTAHYWFDSLQAASTVPFIHIVDATLARLRASGSSGERVGLLATRGARDSRLYQNRLDAVGIDSVVSNDEELDSLFTPGCYAVKRGNLIEGGQFLQRAAEHLLARGATRLVLACTEVPVALASIQSPLLEISVDTNRALASACVAYWHAAQADCIGRIAAADPDP
jgi:aspartate racemase